MAYVDSSSFHSYHPSIVTCLLNMIEGLLTCGDYDRSSMDQSILVDVFYSLNKWLEERNRTLLWTDTLEVASMTPLERARCIARAEYNRNMAASIGAKTDKGTTSTTNGNWSNNIDEKCGHESRGYSDGQSSAINKSLESTGEVSKSGIHFSKLKFFMVLTD